MVLIYIHGSIVSSYICSTVDFDGSLGHHSQLVVRGRLCLSVVQLAVRGRLCLSVVQLVVRGRLCLPVVQLIVRGRLCVPVVQLIVRGRLCLPVVQLVVRGRLCLPVVQLVVRGRLCLPVVQLVVRVMVGVWVMVIHSAILPRCFKGYSGLWSGIGGSLCDHNSFVAAWFLWLWGWRCW